MTIPRLVRALAIASAIALLASCGGGSGGSSGDSGATGVSIGGTVSGLIGTVVLRNNGSDSLSISANSSFTFPTAIANGSAFNVAILTQPAGQVCSVANGEGTASGANVTNVSVTCATNAYTVGGTVSGLSGSVVLQVNGGSPLRLSADGAFTIPSTVVNSTPYSVTVFTHPVGQTCTVVNGAGTMSGANVTNVTVTCATNTFSLGGAVSGLAGTLALRVNGGSDLTVTTDGPFAFSGPLADGTPYSVTVLTQPAGESCSIAGGTGTIAGANVTNVSVSCAANTFTVGGTVSGLSGSLVLQNNGGNDLTIAVNGGFSFPTALQNGSPYSVTVLAQPARQTCTVTNGAGMVIGANVTSVSVACSDNPASYTTNFTGRENPISEGGIWTNGLVTGLDWTNVKTTGGQAVATQVPAPTRYSDDIAHLNKSFQTFSTNQYAQGTVYLAPGYSGNGGSHEVELLLRFEITANNARGYEVLWGITGYIAIVRWNGAVTDYTPLYDPGLGSISVPLDGDVLRAEISGSTISVYKNGAFIASATDSTYTEGQPGIGFWPVDGAVVPENYGWKTFEAGDL